jgi:glutamine amidotransferase
VRVGVFDYGAGNLHSLVKALAGDGRTVLVETDARAAARTDVLILPGVGAFGPAAAALAPYRAAVRDAIESGLPLLGICLGMQLLCDGSDEGPGEGLGVIPGQVTRINAHRIPQIGWNTLDDTTDPLLHATGLSSAYYANGFACRVKDETSVVAWSTHESDRFPAVIRKGPIVGVQFHPEKSSAPGLRFIHGFLDALGR